MQWPDPWVGLNPSFATGGSVPELVRAGLLHPEAERIFRRKSDAQDAGRDPIVLHHHQRQAVEIARTGASYVLTTGTGSGKSLAYIVPIVDAVLRENTERGSRRPGVKAIVVYPMNARANSQVEELRKFLQFGYPEGGETVTFARYTGQESPRHVSVESTAGDIVVHGFRVNMAHLFERLVAWLLADVDPAWSAQLTLPLDQRQTLVIRPDLVRDDGTGWSGVADTKYEVLDEAGKVSNADIYQLVTYCARLVDVSV